MQIITAATIKGGTGKTSTITSLAQAAANAGKKVLVVDLEPQANATFSLAADQNKPGVYQMFNGTPAEELIQTTPQGVDVIPASPDIATLKTTPGSARRLKKALDPIKNNYDYIFIDTPPTAGELVFNALQAATGLIIPLEIDSYSLQGLYQITDIAHQMQDSNPELSIIGVLLSRYDPRPKFSRFIKDAIEQKGAEIGAPLLGTIRQGIAVREAAAMQLSLFDYDPECKPAQDFAEIFKKIDSMEE